MFIVGIIALVAGLTRLGSVTSAFWIPFGISCMVVAS